MTTTDHCVLLLSPGIIKWTDSDFGLPHLVSIGSYLQAHCRVRVEIVDLAYEGGDHRQLARTLETLGPYLVIGVSCYSSFDYLRTLTLGRYLKALYPDTPLVCGGYHASAVPSDLLFDGSPFDVVVPGEGEAGMRGLVETLLGGGRLHESIVAKAVVEDLGTLPPYDWSLLSRYWPRALKLGRKFQIYLSRGCPYRCTFCMERAKTGYQWRAYSAERALEELRRLARFTELSHWVVNIADPLFGFQRAWRRQLLEGILREQLLPRQYWALTRSDDLDDDDVGLLAKANFSIGIGMESGSPEMLARMQKSRRPERYLQALEHLAAAARRHGLTWAANIIVGHPGETLTSMTATYDFARRLFTSAAESCGWLSIDPFRLYPGAQVHEEMDQYELRHGTRFYHRQWWKEWYDASFRAEHLDPSADLDFESRVRFMYQHYGPLVQEIISRFRGQGRSVDRVFARSLGEQAQLMSPVTRDRLLAQARWVRGAGAHKTRPTGSLRGTRGCATLAPVTAPPATADTSGTVGLPVPIGLQVRNPNVRRREQAVTRLLQQGVLRRERVVEALVTVPPEAHLDEPEAAAMLADRNATPHREGEPPTHLGIARYAALLETLDVGLGDRAADLLAWSSYLAALLAVLVGVEGEVVAVVPDSRRRARTLRRALNRMNNVQVVVGQATTRRGLKASFDRLCLPAALPRLPDDLLANLRDEDGRMVTFIGPRFRSQDLVEVTCDRNGRWRQRVTATTAVPIVAGPAGWLMAPQGQMLRAVHPLSTPRRDSRHER